MVRRAIAKPAGRPNPSAKSTAKARAKAKSKAAAKAKAVAMSPTARYPSTFRILLAVYASRVRKSPASFLEVGSGKLVKWEVDDDDILDQMDPTCIDDERRQFVVVRLRVQDPESYVAENGGTLSDIEDIDEVEGVVVEHLGIECYKTMEQLQEMRSA